VQAGTSWHGRLPAAPASSVDVRVLNGASVTGLAAQTAASSGPSRVPLKGR
jgi:hypothetical protein